VLLVRAAAHLACGHPEQAATTAREWLQRGKQGGIGRHFAAVDELVTKVLAFALQQGIEPDHARYLIRLLDQPPPASDIEEWPWPVRVRVLGTPRLEVAQALPGPNKRPQKKPLELLHYIVAQGGEPAAITGAMDALWPETDGDAAKKAFDITLHRLRKLLGADTAVLVEHGRARLNTGYCWVDAFAFARLAERMDQDDLASHALDEALARALTLYRGPVLGGTTDAPWAIAYRSKLRARFTRLVERAGALYTAKGRTEDAERCYRSALDLEPVAEAIYRKLMQSLARRGETAAAMEVYHRCRESLAALLGAKPSPETVAAYEGELGP
jgi:DNA-binding SARP family transcriptional activator